MTLYLGNQKVCPTRTVNSGGERYLIQASDELGSVIVSPVGAWTNKTSIEIYSNPTANDRPFSWETKGFIDLSQLEEEE